MDEVLTPRELSERWGMTPASLAQWRYLRKGPDFVKLGGKVLYSVAAVVEFERRSTVTCSSAA